MQCVSVRACVFVCICACIYVLVGDSVPPSNIPFKILNPLHEIRGILMCSNIKWCGKNISLHTPGFVSPYRKSSQIKWAVFLSYLLEHDTHVARVTRKVEPAPSPNDAESSPQYLK